MASRPCRCDRAVTGAFSFRLQMTGMHDQTEEIIALDRKVMARMAATWSDRVAVRKDRLDLSQYYDPCLPDFPVEIIPFGEDTEFRAVFDGQSPNARLRF